MRDWRPHPHYPDQQHRFDQYSAEATSGETVFAAGEYSNGVWGFFARQADYVLGMVFEAGEPRLVGSDNPRLTFGQERDSGACRSTAD